MEPNLKLLRRFTSPWGAVVPSDEAECAPVGVAECTLRRIGLWIEQSEGAKFWLRVMNELKNRGAEDVLIAIVDGLKGFPEAITAVFPEAQVQTCVVHLIRHSLAFVSYKDRKTVAAALKEIYRAKDAEAGLAALDDFAEGPWNKKYPAIAQSWRRAWGEIIPFYAFPDEVRRIIYTTDKIDKEFRGYMSAFPLGVDNRSLKAQACGRNSRAAFITAPRLWIAHQLCGGVT